MIELRDYQQAAIDALREAYKKDPTSAPCIVLPTGAGKTPIIAWFCQKYIQLGWRGIVLAHRKELIEQSYNTLVARYGVDEKHVGVICGKMGRYETDRLITIASINSIYPGHKYFERFANAGPVRLVLVDEAHLINGKNDDSMYAQFFDKLRNWHHKFFTIGLTATPYRLNDGYIYGRNRFFDRKVYECKINDIVGQYLVPPVARTSSNGINPDAMKISIVNGDYAQDEISDVMIQKCAITCQETIDIIETENRQHVLIFASNRQHGQSVLTIFQNRFPDQCAYIDGNTSIQERDNLIENFRAGRIRILVNINVLTVGFDSPNVDTIVLMRATKSPGLYYQMVGRGFRPVWDATYSEWQRKNNGEFIKPDFAVIDFGTHTDRLGPINNLKVNKNRYYSGSKDDDDKTRECPECGAINNFYDTQCEICGCDLIAIDPKPEELNIALKASNTPIMQIDLAENETIQRTYTVLDVTYFLHKKVKEKTVEVFVCPEDGEEFTEQTCIVKYITNTLKEHECPTHHYLLYAKDDKIVRTESVSLHVKYTVESADVQSGHETFNEWILFDHPSKMCQNRAKTWWNLRSLLPVPTSTEDAYELSVRGCVTKPTKITVYRTGGDNFPRIKPAAIPDLLPFDVAQQIMNAYHANKNKSPDEIDF